MSEEQLSALLAKLKDDAGLREKLQGAADLDAAVAIAKEAGFDVSKADWLRHQAEQTLKLSDEELERIAGAHDEYFSMRKEGGLCGTYDTCKIEMQWCTWENEWFHPDQPPIYI
jgi:predicted ribosomally synthesized peptide with nif11-like leader